VAWRCWATGGQVFRLGEGGRYSRALIHRKKTGYETAAIGKVIKGNRKLGLEKVPVGSGHGKKTQGSDKGLGGKRSRGAAKGRKKRKYRVFFVSPCRGWTIRSLYPQRKSTRRRRKKILKERVGPREERGKKGDSFRNPVKRKVSIAECQDMYLFCRERRGRAGNMGVVWVP